MKKWLILAISFLCFALAQSNGGNLTVAFKDDIATLDPAIGYDWQNWSIIKAIFGGLMDYEPGTTKLVPHFAESFKVSPDGKLYSFKLRKGIQFQNGREMTSADVKYSLERMLNPKTQSPGAGFYGGIVGAANFQGNKAKEVSGIKTPDALTTNIALDKPDASFLHKMALNFSFIVPKEAVEAAGADFGHKPLGAGAYKLTDWKLGQSLSLEKNKNYFIKGKPLLDGLTFLVGLDPNVAYLKLQRGEVDMLGDGIPPAKFVDVMKDPNLKSQVIIGNQLMTGYVTLNTQVKPFNNVKVRQALNMAINKDRIVRLINNRAVPAVQYLPPGMAGYDSNYKGYAYNIEQAKKLLKEAGFANGFSTQLYASNTDPNPRIAQAMQDDLAKIGVKVELKTLANPTVIQAGGTKGQAPMIWSGGMAWVDDYPDPSDFWWPILGCASAAPGGWNWSWYCNKTLDAKAEAADAMVQPGQEAARAKAYSEIFAAAMKDAPWIPIFHEKRYLMHSPKAAGIKAVDPIHTPVNYSEIWAK